MSCLAWKYLISGVRATEPAKQPKDTCGSHVITIKFRLISATHLLQLLGHDCFLRFGVAKFWVFLSDRLVFGDGGALIPSVLRTNGRRSVMCALWCVRWKQLGQQGWGTPSSGPAALRASWPVLAWTNISSIVWASLMLLSASCWVRHLRSSWRSLLLECRHP